MKWVYRINWVALKLIVYNPTVKDWNRGSVEQETERQVENGNKVSFQMMTQTKDRHKRRETNQN